jgi:hypothetical protein
MADYRGEKKRGKLGDLIYSSWNGRPYVRRRPATVANPQTEAQQSHRHAFAEISRLSSAMKVAHTEGLHWQALHQKLNTHSVFKSLNKDCYSSDGIDYSHIRISHGSVTGVSIESAEVNAQGIVEVKFTASPLSDGRNDQFFLYVFCPALRDGAFAKPVNRSEEAVSCQIPDEWRGHDLHLYAFMKDKVGHTSDTIYVGAFK